MNYKKFYEKTTKKIIPKTFHIHHLDLDITNNQIKNLVAIPKKLHEKYHNYIQGTLITFKQIRIEKKYLIPQAVYEGNNRSLNYSLKKLEELAPHFKITVQTIEEIKAWMCYRDYLLGEISNLFDLDYNL